MARSAEPCELSTSIVVSCSVQQCWDHYIDNEQIPRWSSSVEKIDFNDKLVQLGSTRKNHLNIAGKHGHTVEQCTLLDPLKRIAFSVLEETFGFSHMLNEYGLSTSFDVDAEGTLIVIQTRYVAKTIFASAMSATSTQQQLLNLMENTLAEFKRYTEKLT